MDEGQIAAFQRDGYLLLRGFFSGHPGQLALGVLLLRMLSSGYKLKA